MTLEPLKNNSVGQVPKEKSAESWFGLHMKPLLWIIALGIIYLFLSMTAPINASSSEQLGLSNVQLRLIQFTIALPVLVSWIAGVMGYNQLLQYAKSTKSQDQKKAFRRIGFGILILVCGSLITSFVGIIRTRFDAGVPELRPITTIITNYLHIFPHLLGLWLIFSAVKSLSQSVKAPPPPSTRLAISLLFVGGLILLNAWLIFTNSYRQFDPTPGGQATYYLPDIAIILTILLPSALTWLVGVLGVLYSLNYRQLALGAVFKSGISRLSWGLTLVLISAIFLQFLLALGRIRLLALGTGGILGIVYLFIFFQTLGYILISLASKKLTLVEKILSKYTT